MRVVAVDWLGRGGIAECTASWLYTAGGLGAELHVVTRPGRDLAMEGSRTVAVRDRRSPIAAHREVVRAAARAIRDTKPDLVVIQNYVVAMLERPTFEAARAVGARVVWVVHDHRLHSPLAGSRAGFRALSRRADDVVCHSEFVGAAVERFCGRPVRLVPHPQQLRLLRTPGDTPLPFERPHGRLALHFGVLKRRYKGSRLVAQLARAGVPGWSFVLLGVGAPDERAAVCVPRFVSGEELAASVRASEAIVLPYGKATQSGAVVLAQSLGVVPVASAVGAIPEQIENGETGILVPAGAPVDTWREALTRMEPERAALIGAAAQAAAQARHAEFTEWVGSLVGGAGQVDELRG